MKKKPSFSIVLILSLFFLVLNTEASWTTAKRLTYNSGSSKRPAIAIDSNDHLHVVWYDSTPGNWEIFYKQSTDSGTSWITKRLTYTSGGSSNPAIAIDSNNQIHVVWENYNHGNPEIYYKKSTDNGTTWTIQRLTYNSGSSFKPAIAIDSNNHIHVVWYNEIMGNSEIYYKKSTDNGTTWTIQRLTYNSGYSYRPSIAIDSNNYIHVVWYDETPADPEIYYKKSTDSGSSWATKRLTYSEGGSYDPVIATDLNNQIHVTWQDNNPGNCEIYYKLSIDSGISWITKRISYTSDNSHEPAITIDSNNHIHIVWMDYNPGNAEIYYKLSTDYGNHWNTQRFTYNLGNSGNPVIAIDSYNHAHVVWSDYSPGNFEIYYKKN